MQPNSYYSICPLSYPLSDDIVINVLDCASLSAELVLFSWQTISWVVAFLVLLDMVSQMLVVLLLWVLRRLLPSSCDESASLSVLQSSVVYRLRLLGKVGCYSIAKCIVRDLTSP